MTTDGATREPSGKSIEGNFWDGYPFLPKYEKSLCWHYTSSGGFIGIMQTQRLWASSPRVMNDLSEITYGESIFRETFEEMKAIKSLTYAEQEYLRIIFEENFVDGFEDGLYVISASAKGDSLSQWRNYAGNDGVAIGINPKIELSVYAEHPDDQMRHHGEVTLPILGWQEVIYDPIAQKKYCKLILHHIAVATSHLLHKKVVEEVHQLEEFKRLFRLAIYCLLPFLKHPGFSEEQEVRAVFTREASQFHELYRTNKGRLVPYLNIATNLNIVNPPSVNRLPIDVIRCSPSALPSSVQIVRNLISSFGYENTEVNKSDIPYLSS